MPVKCIILKKIFIPVNLFSLSSLLFSCNVTSNAPLNKDHDKPVKIDTEKTIKKDSAIQSIKTFLPTQKRTVTAINKIVATIDKLVAGDNLSTETVDGPNDEPCQTIKYYKDGLLIQIDRECGDCTMYMSSEKYYFENNELIFLYNHYINYGYNPCWTEKDCKENGITAAFKKNNFKTRDERYYFLYQINYFFKRTGNMEDTNYVRNDTLSPSAVLKQASEIINAKQPK